MNKKIVHLELGKTGLYIPQIIFGTSALGNLYKVISEETKLEIIRECFKYVPKPVVFDCAGKYGAGLALEELGRCLNTLKIKENDVIISNKLGWKRINLSTSQPTFEPGVWHGLKFDAQQKISYSGIIECWEQGNSLLGQKYSPQMLSVHDPDEYLDQAKSNSEKKKLFNDILDAYKALHDLKKQGKAQAIGIGAKNWEIIREISEHVQLDWVMFANSLTIMKHPSQLISFIEKLSKKGIGIINSAVFNGGFLIGSNYFDYKPIDPINDSDKLIWRDNFYKICEKHHVIPSVACVNFGMSPSYVTAISLNTSKPEHVKENVLSVTQEVPKQFYEDMIKQKLISPDYPFLK